MKSLSCILLLVERGRLVHSGVNKALLLARHAGARLELFLCDTEPYSALEPYGTHGRGGARDACIAQGREYLQALRLGIICPDVQIGCEAVCAASLIQALADKLQRTPVQIVVRAAGGPRHGASSADWSLVRHCGASVLLTRGRPWGAWPRFVAALDLSPGADARVCRNIVGMSETLARSCGAELSHVYARETEAGVPPAADGISVPAALDARQMRGLQCCSGEPREILPRLLAQRDYDLVALGVPRFNEAAGCSDGVAARVLQAIDADVLFVPSAAAVFPVRRDSAPAGMA